MTATTTKEAAMWMTVLLAALLMPLRPQLNPLKQ